MSEINIRDIHSPETIASLADQLINFELQLNELSNQHVNQYSMLEIKCKHVKSNEKEKHHQINRL